MSSDMLFFIFRFIGFVAISVIFFIAGRMAIYNFIWKEYFEENNELSKLDRRRITARVLFFIGIAVGLSLIWELCVNNPNEWLGMKISWYVFIWLLLTYFAFTPEEAKLVREDREKINPITKVLSILTCISAVATLWLLIFGGIFCASQPATPVEREVLSSVELIAAKDSYQSESKLTDNLPGTTFAISDHGVYRYYCRGENGGIKQDFVDAVETTIYPTKENEAPHLDCITSYEYKTHFRNNKAYKTKNDEKIWYELYVPKGSVVEAYEFDLN